MIHPNKYVYLMKCTVLQCYLRLISVYVHIHLPSFQNKIQHSCHLRQSPLSFPKSHSPWEHFSWTSRKWNHPGCAFLFLNMFVSLTQFLHVSVSLFFGLVVLHVRSLRSKCIEPLFWWWVFKTFLGFLVFLDILWKRVLYTSLHMSFCGRMFSFLLHKHLGEEMLDCEADGCWILYDAAKGCLAGAVPFFILVSLHPC